AGYSQHVEEQLQAVKEGEAGIRYQEPRCATDGAAAGAEARMTNHQRPYCSEPYLLQPVWDGT
ncbi:MAG TPA: hypothetical protein GXX14_05285, partial [Clostridiaceae bacterium]|nr:hypothetical protein [Clostridiaceae bacterium]